MGMQFPVQKFHRCFFITTSFYKHRPFGLTEGVFDDIEKSSAFCLNKYDAKMAGYVLMPTHMHFLLFIDGKKLGDFMRDFKKFVAQRVILFEGIGTSPIWERGYVRVVITSERVFRIKLEYIHKNPIKAGLVKEAMEWPWSSAGVYLREMKTGVAVFRDW